MQRKEKIILCRFRAFNQAFAEGQSTKVNCQELAKEHQDQRRRMQMRILNIENETGSK